MSTIGTTRTVNVNKVIGDSKFNKFFLLVFTLTTLALIFDGYDGAVYGISLPVMIKETGISTATFGFIGSWGLYGMVIGAILFGMLSDKIGRVKTLIISIAIYATFAGLIGICNTALTIGICRTLSGVGLAGVGPVVISLVSEYSPNSHRNLLSSLSTIGVPIGNMLSPLAGIFLLSVIGWRPMFFIGLIPLLLIPFIQRYLPESMEIYLKKGDKKSIQKQLQRADPEFVPNEDDIYRTNLSDSGYTKKGTFSSLFKDGLAYNTILFWIQFALVMLGNYGMITWLPQIMVTMGYSLKQALGLMIVFTLSTIPATYIAGKLSKKYGFRKIIIIGALLFTVVAFAITYTHNMILFVIELILCGATGSIMFGMTYPYITLSYPISCRGTGIGWATAFGRFGGSFGPMIGGILLANKVPVEVNFFVFALSSLLVAFIAFLTKDKTQIFNQPNTADLNI